MRIYAQRIRDALRGAIDTAGLARLWEALHPAGTGETSRPALREFLARAREAIERALSGVLRRLWPEGWVLGQRSAEALLAGVEDADWGSWLPGDPEAAAEIAGPGLRQLLGEAGIIIRSITSTRLEELSGVLERSLSSNETVRPYNGPTPLTLSVQSLARELEDVLDNPGRAELVAQAEIARAQSAAAMRAYAEAGTTEVDWSTAHDTKVCPKCDEAAAAGAIPLGTLFPGVNVPMPPGHPRCRCAVLPVLASRAA